MEDNKAELIGLGAIVAATGVVTTVTMVRHFLHFIRPTLQVCYMRMTLLPFVFGGFALASFQFAHYGIFFEACRGLAEAYVLYVFLVTLVLYAGGEGKVAKMYETKRWAEEFKHTLFCGLLKWRNTQGAEVLRNHKRAVGQLMITKPILTTSIGFLALQDLENDSVKTAIMVCACGNFLCMMILMKTLYVVYQVCQRHLAGMSAVLKFAVIKLMVFITITQGLIVNFLISTGGIKNEDGSRGEEKGNRLLGMLGVVEMFFFSFIFAYAFSAKDSSLTRRSVHHENSSSDSTGPLVTDSAANGNSTGSDSQASSVAVNSSDNQSASPAEKTGAGTQSYGGVSNSASSVSDSDADNNAVSSGDAIGLVDAGKGNGNSSGQETLALLPVHRHTGAICGHLLRFWDVLVNPMEDSALTPLLARTSDNSAV